MCEIGEKHSVRGAAFAVLMWKRRITSDSVDQFQPRPGTYQGELVDKEEYTRAFFDCAGKDPGYDLSKLSYLWQRLLAECVA